MSEKVTFQELIESIAKETDNSKQFTHDFLKDFVDVINSGLESDGNVNIAGLGKFKLQRVDEREGYNPQTEEKMTIPAHNRVIFKPYKDLRELVNAPYAHLEPELIKEELDSQEEEKETEDPAGSEQEDFIPTGPPTSHKKETEETNSEDEQEEEAPFDPDESETSSTFTFEEESDESDEEQDDVVEFSGESGQEDEEVIDDELSEFIGSDEETQQTSQETTEEAEESIEESEEHSPEEEQSPFATDFEEPQDEEIESEPEESAPAPAIDKQQTARKEYSSLPIVAAAGFILLLAVGGAWYFGFFDKENLDNTTTNQAVTKAEMPSSADNQETTQQSDQDQSQQTANNQQQNKQSGQSQTAQQTSQAQQDKEKEDMTIAKGQTLWSIAEEKYDNPRLWPWIYDTNESLGNPNIIHAGNSLTVPLPSGPNFGLTNSDSVAVAKGYISTYRWYKDNGSSKAKNYLWVAKRYHNDIRDIADVQIDKSDLAFANQSR